MDTFKVISFTYKNLPLELLGKLHLTSEQQSNLLTKLKINFEFHELMFLSTCNRIELFINSNHEVNKFLIREICLFINANLNDLEADILSEKADVYTEQQGVEHLLKVASSLESMVVGEREIITQVRKAYDFCNLLGLTKDFLRLLVKQTIETAKEVYTKTEIAKNPVSIVSLAYRQLRDLGIKNDARFVFVGSGETNTAMANYLLKHKFANFTVFSRTFENAKKLAKTLKGDAYELSEIANYKKGFDVLVICTASNTKIITKEIYKNLNLNETSRKIIIDLSLPANVDEEVVKDAHRITHIDINSLKTQAENNMQLRKNEIIKCENIIRSKSEQFIWLHKERRIELAFGEVPKQVRAIKDLALNEIFAKEINSLDVQSKEVLDKVLAYVEKKYNAVAIKTAKSVLLNSKD